MNPLASALSVRVPDRRRVEDYYAPLAIAIEARRTRAQRRPLVVGLQGPQGCGKSTLAAALVDAFGDVAVRAISISIDDFYLTHAEQCRVAHRHTGNRCLAHRDIRGRMTCRWVGRPSRHYSRLVTPTEATPSRFRVPGYDKSAHGGRGDRFPPERWRSIAGPLDLVLVEGWMLGFAPAPDESLDADLRAPNAYLAAYADWPAKLDALVHLDVTLLDTIVRWRVDAERARRSRGDAALGDEDASDYIERFLPAYRIYVPSLQARPPCEDFVRILLDEDRMPAATIAWAAR